MCRSNDENGENDSVKWQVAAREARIQFICEFKLTEMHRSTGKQCNKSFQGLTHNVMHTVLWHCSAVAGSSLVVPSPQD